MKKIFYLFVASCLISKMYGMNSPIICKRIDINKDYNILHIKSDQESYELSDSEGTLITRAVYKEGKYSTLLRTRVSKTNDYFYMTLKGLRGKEKFDELATLYASKNKILQTKNTKKSKNRIFSCIK